MTTEVDARRVPTWMADTCMERLHQDWRVWGVHIGEPSVVGPPIPRILLIRPVIPICVVDRISIPNSLGGRRPRCFRIDRVGYVAAATKTCDAQHHRNRAHVESLLDLLDHIVGKLQPRRIWVAWVAQHVVETVIARDDARRADH